MKRVVNSLIVLVFASMVLAVEPAENAVDPVVNAPDPVAAPVEPAVNVVEPVVNVVVPPPNMENSNQPRPDEIQQKKAMENGALSYDQHVKIKEIHDRYRVAEKEISDKLMETRKSLMKEMEADPRSETNISSLKNEMTDLQAKMKTNRESLKTETDGVYTPEQIAKRNVRVAEQAEKAKKAKQEREAKQAQEAQ